MKSVKSSRILIPMIVAIAIISLFFDGCTQRNNIISDTPVNGGPAIDVSLNRISDQPGSESRIEVVIQITGNESRIEKVIYSITGATVMVDTFTYSPALMEISESIPVTDDIGLDPESRLALKIIAIDEYGSISSFEHSFDPVDLQSPTITIDFDNSHGYAPNDAVDVHITASDNAGLYFIEVSTAGAFAHNDTLMFAEPYPTEIDTIISIPIPLTGYLDFEFWITAEAVDINLNSSLVSPDEELWISFAGGPLTEIHPVGGSLWARQGDSLRFWVVGYYNSPLSCLGYRLQYGRDEIWFTIDLRDSLSSEFNFIDSAYFAYHVPDTVYCDNYLYIESFAYSSYRYSSQFNHLHVEDRIRFSQATTFETTSLNSWGPMLVDDRRERVYIANSMNSRIEIYSQTTRELLAPIILDAKPSWFCLSPDTNSILVTHEEIPLVSIFDLSQSDPQLDTYIALPGMPYRIATLSDGTALIMTVFENNLTSMLRMDLSNYYIDSLELGVGNLFEVVASGNSEYALMAASASPGSQLFIYQTGVGVVTTGAVVWNHFWAAANHDGSRYFIGNWNFGNTAVLDNNLELVATIPDNSCNQYIEAGVFSRDGRDLYLRNITNIAHATADNWTLEGYYGFWPQLDMWTFIGMATNAADNRLFVTGQTGAYDFFFWDIPIGPE